MLPAIGHLLIVLLVSPCADAITAYVSQDATDQTSNTTTFYQAVLNPRVTEVVIVGNYTLGEEFRQYRTAPLQLDRNVTVTALHGTDDVLDLQFARSKVQLCATCVWTWRNITVANERRGAGAAWDFFVGDSKGQALVIGEDMVRWRWACTAANYSRETLESNQRPAVAFSTGQDQEYSLEPVTWQGQEYPDTLVLHDHGAVIARTVQEGRGASGGYNIWDLNVSRVCRYVIGSDCLEVRSSEACVNDRIDKALADLEAASSRISPGTLAAIIVPIVAVLAVSTLLGLLLWRRLRRKRQQKQLLDITQQYKPTQHDSGNSTNKWSGLHEILYDDGHNSKPSDVTSPSSNRRGWELTCSLTNPVIGQVEDMRISFGELLGAGSFGRVYRGTWAGRAVAIKVIEYDTTSRDDVENEVQLMLSFNHPNIVRAYHSVTYTHTGATTGSGKDSGRMGSGVADQQYTRVPGSKELWPELAPAQPTESPSTGKSSAHRSDGGSWNHSGPQQRTAAVVTAAAGSSNSSSSATTQQRDAGSHDQQKGSGGVADPNGSACWTIAERDQQQQPTDAPGQFLSVIAAPSRVETWLVQEYCDCGTLSNVGNRLRGAGAADNMLRLVLLLADVANGLKVLHSSNTVHGDLNARNVLVASNSNATFGCTAKLADLGLSRTLMKHRTHRTTDTVGTMSHMPPELLRYGKQSPAGDIYAFGIMMWELYTGAQAFKDLHYGQFFEEIVLNNVRPPLPSAMPADYLLLMDHCWAADPTDRPTVDRLLQCIEFMIQERQKTLNGNMHSSAVLSVTPQAGTTPTSGSATGTPKGGLVQTL